MRGSAKAAKATTTGGDMMEWMARGEVKSSGGGRRCERRCDSALWIMIMRGRQLGRTKMQPNLNLGEREQLRLEGRAYQRKQDGQAWTSHWKSPLHQAKSQFSHIPVIGMGPHERPEQYRHTAPRMLWVPTVPRLNPQQLHAARVAGCSCRFARQITTRMAPALFRVGALACPAFNHYHAALITRP